MKLRLALNDLESVVVAFLLLILTSVSAYAAFGIINVSVGAHGSICSGSLAGSCSSLFGTSLGSSYSGNYSSSYFSVCAGSLASSGYSASSCSLNLDNITDVNLAAVPDSGYQIESLTCSGPDYMGRTSSNCAYTMGDNNTNSFAVTFKRLPQAISLISTPLRYSNQPSGSIAFSTNEASTFQCSLDNGAYTSCTSPYVYLNLANGQHTLFIRATDGFGIEAQPTTFIWTINTFLPESSASRVPQTGQTTSYSAGDDGAIMAGVAFSDPRFTDKNNGTVIDNLTGLIWLKNANCFGETLWANALSSANSLTNGACGLSDGSIAGDWRLPNIKELKSLTNRQQTNQANWLNSIANGFINTSAFCYWSSSTYANTVNFAWYMNMESGNLNYVSKSVGSCFVWPVRGGP